MNPVHGTGQPRRPGDMTARPPAVVEETVLENNGRVHEHEHVRVWHRLSHSMSLCLTCMCSRQSHDAPELSFMPSREALGILALLLSFHLLGEILPGLIRLGTIVS